jgi:hypothetical protein
MHEMNERQKCSRKKQILIAARTLENLFKDFL